MRYLACKNQLGAKSNNERYDTVTSFFQQIADECWCDANNEVDIPRWQSKKQCNRVMGHCQIVRKAGGVADAESQAPNLVITLSPLSSMLSTSLSVALYPEHCIQNGTNRYSRILKLWNRWVQCQARRYGTTCQNLPNSLLIDESIPIFWTL
jgi:hypothetical protein